MNLPASSRLQFTPDLSMLSIKRDVASVSAHGRIDPKKRYPKYVLHGCRLHDLGSGRPLWPRRQSSDVNCLPPVAKMLYPTYKLSQSGYQGRLESQRSWSSRTLIFPQKDMETLT